MKFPPLVSACFFMFSLSINAHATVWNQGCGGLEKALPNKIDGLMLEKVGCNHAPGEINLLVREVTANYKIGGRRANAEITIWKNGNADLRKPIDVVLDTFRFGERLLHEGNQQEAQALEDMKKNDRVITLETKNDTLIQFSSNAEAGETNAILYNVIGNKISISFDFSASGMEDAIAKATVIYHQIKFDQIKSP